MLHCCVCDGHPIVVSGDLSLLLQNMDFYYPTLLRRVQISRETSTNITRYLYSSHSSRPREVQNLGKSEFWEKKSLDNKSLIRRFGVIFLLVVCILTRPTGSSKYRTTRKNIQDNTPKRLIRYIYFFII